MKRTFINAKVGQKVWSLKMGKGTISELGVNTLCVEFFTAPSMSRNPRLSHLHYTYSGRTHVTDRTPDLYLKKPVITTKARLTKLTSNKQVTSGLKPEMFIRVQEGVVEKVATERDLAIEKLIQKGSFRV